MYNDIVADGINYVHIQGIDNILTKSADPVLTGLLIEKELDLCFKVIVKKDSAENVGLHVKKNGVFTVHGCIKRIRKYGSKISK